MVKLGKRVHGPDVYEGDGNIDWAKVSKSGALFAIIKISEGDYKDTTASSERVKAIRRAGLTAGGYVFMRPKPGRTGAQEFRLFYEHGRSIGLWARDGQIVRDLRPVLDVEATAFDTSTLKGRYMTRRYVRSAINECIKLTGHKPIVYTGRWFWDDTIRCRWSMGCPLWLASYPAQSSPIQLPTSSMLPKAWRRAELWQFTDQQVVPGISRPCDYNVYVGGRGSSAEFRAHLTF